MAQNIFRLVLTDEAQNFIESLPEAVSYKIYYNIKRVAGGEDTLVIATHGIIKKTQKTPNKEIAKAEAIRKEYFKNK